MPNLTTNGNVKQATTTAPKEELHHLAAQWQMDVNSDEFAQQLDACKRWPNYRDRFCIPLLKDLSSGKHLPFLYV